MKVLTGVPVGPDFVVLSLSEVLNPLEEVTSFQKADGISCSCVVLPSTIGDPGAGEGLYAGKNFPGKKVQKHL